MHDTFGRTSFAVEALIRMITAWSIRRMLRRTALGIVVTLAVFGVYSNRNLQGSYRLSSLELPGGDCIDCPYIERERSFNSVRDTSTDMKFVICAKVKNEAPYLREWIEYHRMIGFDSFLLMNDNSTDQTQCILDAYAQEGIVKRIPEEIDESIYGKQDVSTTLDTAHSKEIVYDICTKYLASQGDAHRTWMMTHDTDEFVWFNKTNGVDSFRDAIQNLQQTHGSTVKSMLVPRFVFGSSGHEKYEPGLVIERFRHRFNLDSCTAETGKISVTSRLDTYMKYRSESGNSKAWPLKKMLKQPRNPLRLHPEKYCSYKESSYDSPKSLSLVSSLALDCSVVDKKMGKRTPVLCVKTHWHRLKPILSSNTTLDQIESTTYAASVKEVAREDPRYLSDDQVGRSIVIMHYITKSRDEFIDRVCESSHGNSYRCPGCTPTKYFNLTDEFANNYEDNRMIPLSKQLSSFMDASTIGASCETKPTRRSSEYYNKCFDRLKTTNPTVPKLPGY